MRVEKIQQKISQEVTIPEELRSFLQEVDELIRQQDELATTESDDLLQAERAYGGLIEEGTDRYQFTYFPGEDTRPTWELEMTATEISAIAKGQIAALSLWRCPNINCGSHFASAEGVCFDCDYLDEELDRKKVILKTLLQSVSKEEWVKGYLRHYPDAHPLQIIGDYNSQGQLGNKWGFFTLGEMQALVQTLLS